MELLIFVAALAILALAALCWGAKDGAGRRGRIGAGGILSEPGRDKGWRLY